MGDLGLMGAVHKHFHFLCDEWEFSHCENTAFTQNFKRGKILLSITFDGRRSYEVDCFVGNADANGTETYTAEEVQNLFRSQGPPWQLGVVRDRNSMEISIRELSTWVRKCFYPLLVINDKDLWTTLKQNRARTMQLIKKTRILKEARERAKGAWEKKNYVDFIAVLSPFRTELTKVEMKKIEYAKRASKGTETSSPNP